MLILKKNKEIKVAVDDSSYCMPWLHYGSRHIASFDSHVCCLVSVFRIHIRFQWFACACHYHLSWIKLKLGDTRLALSKNHSFKQPAIYSSAIAFLEGLRYTICICAAMAAMTAKLGYSCAKWRSYNTAIALSLAQCYYFGLLDN